MLRCILFDLDRTLLDRDTSITSFAAAQFDRLMPYLHGIERESYIHTFIQLDARGSLWKDKVYQRLVKDLCIQSITWEDLFADFDTHVTTHYVPFPDLHETLQALAQHYRLGLITNGNTAFQTRTIDTLNIAPFFDIILISEAEGIRKPAVEIFHRALHHMNTAPHKAAYIGDHPISDMKGARDAGLLAIWKRNADFSASEVTCDASFDHLSELPSILHHLHSTTEPPPP